MYIDNSVHSLPADTPHQVEDEQRVEKGGGVPLGSQNPDPNSDQNI